MTLYRVHVCTHSESSHGYRYFTSELAAKKFLIALKKDDPEDDNSDWEPIDVLPTKKGIMFLLTQWAAHPNNG